MPSRVSLVFNITTTPTVPIDAGAHSGGWTEGHWLSANVGATDARIDRLILMRKAMLPVGVRITGVKIALYTISGNKLLPGGTSAAKKVGVSSQPRTCDMPWVALEFSGSVAGAPNASRFTTRGMPDDQFKGGEYQPNDDFKGQVTAFRGQLIADAWGFVGRNLTLPTARVMSIANSQVVLDGSVGGARLDFLKLNRVYDDNGNPVKGSFPIVSVVDNVYTVSGTLPTITRPSGLARIDQVAFMAYAGVTVGRVVTKKVGRPSESYRGRRYRVTH